MNKKIIKIICLFFLAFLLSQCTTQEILIYNHSKDDKASKITQISKDFYDFRQNKTRVNANRILFIGDSHIANDTISQYFRSKLNIHQSFLNHFITPKYQQNNTLSTKAHNFIKTPLKDNDIGINMTTFMAENNAFVEFSGNIKNAGIFVKFKSKDDKITIKQNDKIVKIFTPKGNFSWQKLELNLNDDFTLFSTSGILFAGFINQDEKYVDNIGVNGAQIAWLYHTDNALLSLQKSILDYDLIVICFGTNEAINANTNINQFSQNLTKLIKLLKQKNTNVVLLSPHKSVYFKDGKYEVGELFSSVRKAIYDTAKQNQTMLYDMNIFMQNNGGKQTMIENGYSQNDTHLTLNGYKKLAIRLFSQIL